MPGSSDEPTATRATAELCHTDPDSAGRASASLELTPGTLLAGRYRVVSMLGAGGMGEVYRAEDLRLGQAVALKFLPRRSSAASIDQLVAEVKVGRELAHPNVCRLYDIVDDARAFIVMEYVDGEDLAALLRRIGRLPADKAVSVARDLLAGLAAIHDRGIVHRDLKPGNVMLDGSGRARITDFGLAHRGERRDGSLSGTPAYMAPEQLAGQPASVASDLYAFGLVLYEMATGTRLIRGGNLAEIRAQHRARPTLALSETAPGLDRAVEAVVRQCLEPDPAARPRSARAALAALPGADPLEAAIAAGETPSPEMVAAAAEVGDLAPVRAWGLLVAMLAGLGGVVALHGATTIHRRAPLPLSPSVLAQRATDVLSRVGLGQAGTHTAFWFEEDRAWLEHVGAQPSPDRWGRLPASPGAYRFCFRSSPEPMFARQQAGESRISASDPPFALPGMTWVVLDADGRLEQLVRLPTDPGARPTPDTVGAPALFAAAGLDPRSFTRVTPELIGPTDNDLKQAWRETDAGTAGALRVEAAWLGEKPVWFFVIRPWTQAVGPDRLPWPAGVAPRPAGRSPAFSSVAIVVNIAFLIVLPIGTWLLVVRNLRRGRVDRKSTVKLTLFFFVALFGAGLLRADHIPSFVDEWTLLSFLVAYCAFWSAIVAVFYVAVEPIVRRRWPRTLISWTRLLGGRISDPMVGRDLLYGFAAGLVVVVAWHLSALAPAWAGLPAPIPLEQAASPLASARHVGYYLLRNAAEGVGRAFGLLALLVLLRGVLRSTAAALVVTFVPLAVSFLGDPTGDLPFRLAYAAVAAALAILVLLRFGLLALCACAFLILDLRRLPLVVDPGCWYFGRSCVVLLLLAGLSLWAFRTSLAGKPVLGGPLFEE